MTSPLTMLNSQRDVLKALSRIGSGIEKLVEQNEPIDRKNVQLTILLKVYDNISDIIEINDPWMKAKSLRDFKLSLYKEIEALRG